MRETATSEQIETLMGTWCMLAYDVDRQVSVQGQKSWSSITSPGVDEETVVNFEMLASIMEFLQRTLLDPPGVYIYLNPAAPVAAPTPGIKKQSGRFIPAALNEELESNKADEESDLDRNARLRFGALSAFRWLFGKPCQSNAHNSPHSSIDARLASKITSLDDLSGLLSNPLFWTSLCCSEHAPWIPDPELHSLGHGQPQVRQATWALLSVLLQRYKGDLGAIYLVQDAENHAGTIEPFIPILSTVLLRSAWVETDSGVRNALFQPVLIFLKGKPILTVLTSNAPNFFVPQSFRTLGFLKEHMTQINTRMVMIRIRKTRSSRLKHPLYARNIFLRHTASFFNSLNWGVLDHLSTGILRSLLFCRQSPPLYVPYSNML